MRPSDFLAKAGGCFRQVPRNIRQTAQIGQRGVEVHQFNVRPEAFPLATPGPAMMSGLRAEPSNRDIFIH